MGKRNKQGAKGRHAQGESQPGHSAQSAHQPVHQPGPPKKQPVWLAISVILFALWLVFLLVTAVFG